jgi:hypothetical protein
MIRNMWQKITYGASVELLLVLSPSRDMSLKRLSMFGKKLSLGKTSYSWASVMKNRSLMSIHTSVLVDSVGPPSAEVCRAAASFP